MKEYVTLLKKKCGSIRSVGWAQRGSCLDTKGYQDGENPQETGLAGILLKVASATQRQAGQGWGLLREAGRPLEILMEV